MRVNERDYIELNIFYFISLTFLMLFVVVVAVAQREKFTLTTPLYKMSDIVVMRCVMMKVVVIYFTKT